MIATCWWHAACLLGHACLLMICTDWHAGFVLTTVEAIGDITATEEASALATFGDKHNRRVQGGLLGDGQYFGRVINLHTMQVTACLEICSIPFWNANECCNSHCIVLRVLLQRRSVPDPIEVHHSLCHAEMSVHAQIPVKDPACHMHAV